MRFAIAMLVGAICMFALGSGMRYSEVQNTEEAEVELRRVKWAGEVRDEFESNQRVPDPRLDRSVGVAEELERLLAEKRAQERAVQASFEKPNDTLAQTWRELERRQLELDRLKARLEAELLTGVAMVEASQPIDIPQRAAQADEEDTERTRVLRQVYRDMSADAVASIIGDLLESEQTTEVMSVLQILDDRKAARVLAEVAGPRPRIASMLAERLAARRIR